MKEWTADEVDLAESQIRGERPLNEALKEAEEDDQFLQTLKGTHLLRRVVELNAVMRLFGWSSLDAAKVALVIGIRVGTQLEKNRAECASLEKMMGLGGERVIDPAAVMKLQAEVQRLNELIVLVDAMMTGIHHAAKAGDCAAVLAICQEYGVVEG